MENEKTGKTIIIKRLGLSLITYLAPVTDIPDWVCKEVTKMAYNFLWNGATDKVKRDVIVKEFWDGGMKMTDISLYLKACKAVWIKRFMSKCNSDWKLFFEFFMNKQDLKLFLRGNFDENEVMPSTPTFYKDVLKYWKETNVAERNILSDFVWYNKHIKLNGKTVYFKEFMDAGIWYVEDMFDRNGDFLSFDILTRRGVVKNKYMQWFSLIHSIPKCWKATYTQTNTIPSTTTRNVGLCLDGKMIEYDKVKVKHIYQILLSKKKTILATGRMVHSEKHSIENDDWKNIYLLPRIVTKNNNLRDFQFKILHRFLATNKKLYKYGISNTTSCTFCQLQQEDIEHLFFNCIHVRNFWLFFENWWKEMYHGNTYLTIKDILFGFSYKDPPVTLNQCILLGKKYIYKQKLNSAKPDGKVCVVYLKCTLQDMDIHVS